MSNDLYKREYSSDFVSRWDDLIDWDGRQRGEDGFFEELLSAHGARHVADVACGTGYHAITLARQGFRVTAADGSANMMRRAERNADAHEVTFEEARVVDWRRLPDAFGEDAFDALLCLGNAFTHLFEHEARRDALAAMHAVVKPGGLVAIDHRNYDRILDEGFSSKHRYYYTGGAVDARPIRIRPDLVRFEYSYADDSKFHLNLFPLRQDYMSRLLGEAGFRDIARYGDFKPSYGLDEVDFIQQVGVKPRS